MNEVSEALLKVADLVEQDPSRLKMTNAAVPEGCGRGETGCLMAWAAYYMGFPAGSDVDSRGVTERLGFHFSELANYLHKEVGSHCWHERITPRDIRAFAHSEMVNKKTIQITIKVKEAVSV